MSNLHLVIDGVLYLFAGYGIAAFLDRRGIWPKRARERRQAELEALLRPNDRLVEIMRKHREL